jgi:succinate dehydrogenase flavin-adding protein (antitoxin of CptAB toxin-antitoxin module)
MWPHRRLLSTSVRALRAPTRAGARSVATAAPPAPPAPPAPRPHQEWLGAHLQTPQGGAPSPPNLPARRRRIMFRARQRGWLELDVLLGRWATLHVPGLVDEADVARVEALLDAETPHLYEWIVGVSEAPPPYAGCEALRSLREFARGSGVVEQRT